jgi:H+/gluconate symporter-like permease
VTLLILAEQKSVQLNIPVLLVTVTSCKQVTLSNVTALPETKPLPVAPTLEFATSVDNMSAGKVPVSFTVMYAILVSP